MGNNNNWGYTSVVCNAKKMKKEQSIKIVDSLVEDLNICFHWKNEFNILFPEEGLLYDLYNETASNFFYYLSKFYFDYFILAISKLLDPAKMGSNENLSLYQLVVVAKQFFPDKQEEIKLEIDKIKEESKRILKARKKINAHRDLKLAIKKGNLGKTDFSEIESILSKMVNVINTVQKLLGEQQCSFVWFTDRHGAASLIQSLKQCAYYRDLRHDDTLYERINKVEISNKYHKL